MQFTLPSSAYQRAPPPLPCPRPEFLTSTGRLFKYTTREGLLKAKLQIVGVLLTKVGRHRPTGAEIPTLHMSVPVWSYRPIGFFCVFVSGKT